MNGSLWCGSDATYPLGIDPDQYSRQLARMPPAATLHVALNLQPFSA